MGLLDGKVAIITGAGGGIGRCHALLFASEGAKVVVNDLGGTLDGVGSDSSMASQVVAEIRAAGGEAAANFSSVSNAAGVDALFQEAIAAYGRVDILVNNAGILRDKTLLKLEEPLWDAVLDVHLKGTYLCGRALALHVKERAEGGDLGGVIVNTSSYAGLMGNYGQSNYAAAKAGIAGLTRVWALELRKLGVRVNCIAPMAKTRMTEDIAMVPEEMRPEQVAPMALFLASELASEVSGRIFGVHGQQLLEYRQIMTEGATKSGQDLWTPSEIQASLAEIAALESERSPSAAPAPAPRGPGAVIDAAFSRLPEVFLAPLARNWTARLVFDIAGADPWTIEVADQTCATRKGKAADPTCVVTTDAETYAAVIKGELKPDKAFMAGKIKATNLGDVMKFATAFDMKKVKAIVSEVLAQAAPAPAVLAPAAKPSGPEAVIDAAFSRLPEVFLPARAKGWTARLVFDIAGAAPWTIEVADQTCTTRKGKAADPTCVVTTDAETYAAVLQGELKPDKAFMAGKIKATNLGDVMKFATAFDMKRAKAIVKEALAAAPTAPAPAAAPAPVGPTAVIDQAFQILPQLFVPERAKGWSAVVQFEIAGANPWTITVADGACRTEPGQLGAPTCVVTTDAETYAAVVKGELKPDKAFMAGKIKATNLGDMMKFATAFDMKKAQELAKRAPTPAAAGALPAGAATTPQGLVDLAFERIASAFKPAAAGDWEACLHFDLQGGEGWTLRVSGGRAEAQRGLAGEPTCVVKVSLEDYAAVLRGELKAETAFMNKRIRATNMGEMLKFGRSFDLLPLQAELKAAAPGPPQPEAKPKGLNRDLLGQRYSGREPLFVRPEHLALFAEATEDRSPSYEGPDAIAPPLFAVRLLKDVLFQLVGDERLGADLLNLVHGEQDMEFLRPLRPWDLCATRAWVSGIEDKETGQVLRVEEEVWAGGELAVRVKASMFIRDPAKKRSAPKAKGAPPARPAPSFSRQVSVPLDGGPRYAEASLDNNPIHTDEEVARLAGFPGLILQGLCTMAMAGAAVVAEAGGGDPRRLRRLKVRFSRPVLMGDVLRTEGSPGETPGAITFQVVNLRGEAVVTEGEALLAPPA